MHGETACRAPSVQLFFRPDGEVRSCCINSRPLGHVGRDRLSDIWNGESRRSLVARLAAHDFGGGCSTCGAEVALEGRVGSYPATFDTWAGDVISRRWPTVLDFNLSITCNLQCVQCDGDQSSSIRLHRERRPPLRSPYGEQFFEEVEPFLRHASLARFAGGEPFLAEENFRLWSVIPRVAPDLSCTVITNATRWGDRIERVLEELPMHVVMSIDGITRSTYESIRIGADFDEVMKNVDRFIAYTERVGTTASINHCLMVQNVHEFPDLLRFAEHRGLRVNVSVVREPEHCSLIRQPVSLLVSVLRTLRSRAEVAEGLVLNADTWITELARIESWAAASSTRRRLGFGISDQTVLMFPRHGTPGNDDTLALSDLGRERPSATVHSIDVGPDDLIVSRSDTWAALDLADVVAVGASIEALLPALISRHGSPADQRVLSEDADRVDMVLSFDAVEARVCMVAIRGADGVAWTGRVLVAFGPRDAGG